jgi:glutamine amidotransferase
MVAVIDYNMGNLGSVMNAFSKIGADSYLVSSAEELSKFDRVVLPGVGAFPDAMNHLKNSGMNQAILEFAKSGKPILGTCLGMQLLFEKSQEFGNNDGLGLIKGEVVPFDKSKFDNPELKIPHMGWNELFVKKDTPLFDGLDDDFYLYFVHSFHVQTEQKYIIGSTFYGYEFASAVNQDNIFGFQPHPEKSHKIGLKILTNFINL